MGRVTEVIPQLVLSIAQTVRVYCYSYCDEPTGFGPGKDVGVHIVKAGKVDLEDFERVRT